LDAIAAFSVWLLMPSTLKVTTLEEMSDIFNIRVRKHVKYQSRKILPWSFERLVSYPLDRLLHKSHKPPARPPPFYVWWGDQAAVGMSQEGQSRTPRLSDDVTETQSTSVMHEEPGRSTPERESIQLAEAPRLVVTGSDPQQNEQDEHSESDPLLPTNDTIALLKHFVLVDVRNEQRYAFRPVSDDD